MLELLFNWWNFGQLSAIVKYDSSSFLVMVYFVKDVLDQIMSCEKMDGDEKYRKVKEVS